MNAVCKSVHYHIRAVRHIRSCISEDMAKMVMCVLSLALASTTLTRFYLEQLKRNISKLQKAQNILTRVVTCSPQSCSSRTLLQQLYWLPVKHRIDFKIANITFRTFQLTDVHPCHACHSTRSLSLSNTNFLSALFVRTSGARSFSVAAPKIWNSLPPSLRVPVLIPTVVTLLTSRHSCRQQAFQST